MDAFCRRSSNSLMLEFPSQGPENEATNVARTRKTLDSLLFVLFAAIRVQIGAMLCHFVAIPYYLTLFVYIYIYIYILLLIRIFFFLEKCYQQNPQFGLSTFQVTF